MNRAEQIDALERAKTALRNGYGDGLAVMEIHSVIASLRAEPSAEQTAALERLEEWLTYNEGYPDRHISEHRESYVSLFDLRVLASALRARTTSPVQKGTDDATK